MSKGTVNKVILIGNLGADPEVRYMPSGSAVANLSVATSESWKDRNTGEPQERTEWNRVALFGKTAEIAGQYLRKGSKVYIEGKLRTRKWQDQSGQDRYTTEVVVDVGGTMQMLDSRGGGSVEYDDRSGAGSAPRSQQPRGGTSEPPPPAHDAPFDDDIPF